MSGPRTTRPQERVAMFQMVTREWAVDVDAIRKDFGYALSQDGIDLTDDQAVSDAAWDNDVREPYFELQREDDDAPR